MKGFYVIARARAWTGAHVGQTARNSIGMEVSITTTHKEGLVVVARSMPGNPYDGHTLAEALEQAAILSDSRRSPWSTAVTRVSPSTA